MPTNRASASFRTRSFGTAHAQFGSYATGGCPAVESLMIVSLPTSLPVRSQWFHVDCGTPIFSHRASCVRPLSVRKWCSQAPYGSRRVFGFLPIAPHSIGGKETLALLSIH